MQDREREIETEREKKRKKIDKIMNKDREREIK